jgi:NAD(P)-dependent dehydrogenase (short-subunit alcohol dehydrogenase family)
MSTTKKLAGKVAVVTGASKGIGTAIAKHLAAEGASVVVNYSLSKAGAEKVVSEITAQGGKAVAVQANVAKQADIQNLFAETKKAFGKLDVLVNNAGIYEFLPLEQVNAEHFREAIRFERARPVADNSRGAETIPRHRQHYQRRFRGGFISRSRRFRL